MANQEHYTIVKQGGKVWNQWREEHPMIQPDLSRADLNGADLGEANLRRANLTLTKLNGSNLSKADLSYANLGHAQLRGADLSFVNVEESNLNHANLNEATLIEAYLCNADLSDATLRGANLSNTTFNGVILGGADLNFANLNGASLDEANLNSATLVGATLGETILRDANLSGTNLSFTNLNGANMRNADLRRANLNQANLSDADFSGVNLSDANLSRATLVRTNFAEAILTQCRIFGITAWNVELKGARQNDLIITPDEEPVITVDHLILAQFISLLLTNGEIRDIIATITSNVVLLFGRFTPERKAGLDALKEELRTRNYTPVVFDFEKPTLRDRTQTISTLARLARFIIVDLTAANSAEHEIATVIHQTIVPVQPLCLREAVVGDEKGGEPREISLFEDLRQQYHWVLPVHTYTDQANLFATLKEQVIEPAEQKAQELEKR